MIFITALNRGEAKRAAKVQGIKPTDYVFITKAAELKPADATAELWLVKGWERWPEFNITLAFAHRKGMAVLHKESI